MEQEVYSKIIDISNTLLLFIKHKGDPNGVYQALDKLLELDIDRKIVKSTKIGVTLAKCKIVNFNPEFTERVNNVIELLKTKMSNELTTDKLDLKPEINSKNKRVQDDLIEQYDRNVINTETENDTSNKTADIDKPKSNTQVNLSENNCSIKENEVSSKEDEDLEKYLIYLEHTIRVKAVKFL